jgi:hypothetical protein
MPSTYVKVSSVEPGMFSSERAVSFAIENRRISLVVDESAVDESRNLLRVAVVDRTSTKALIDLPGEPFNAGARLFVPADLLIEK